MSSVVGKVAVVTGATAGLGKAIAKKLASCGAKVVVNGRSEESGSAVVSEIERAGGEALFVSADMLLKSEAIGLIDRAVERFGRIDILVSSAGANSSNPVGDNSQRAESLFLPSDPEEIADFLRVNTLRKLNPVHAAATRMAAQGSGSVLIMTSQGGRVATPGQTAVSLHAGGLIMMTKVVAKELSRFKIRVNSLAVTLVQDTRAWNRFTGKEMTAVKTRAFEKIIERAPYGIATPNDISEVATFLVSDAAMFVTGETISAVGGSSFA